MDLAVLIVAAVALVAIAVVVVRALSGLARGAVLGVIVLVSLAGVAWVAWVDLGHHPRWDEASPNGDSDGQIVVGYVGNECEDQRSATVDETDRSVTITVTTRTLPTACSDIGVRHTVIVDLDRPLGDRALLDGSCKQPRSCERKLTG